MTLSKDLRQDYSVSQLASLSGIPARTIEHRLAHGHIAGHRMPWPRSHWRVSASEVRRLLEAIGAPLPAGLAGIRPDELRAAAVRVQP